MAERDRTDTDTDIEFDFFEDLPTSEQTAREATEERSRRSGGPPLRPRSPGGGGSRTPLVRLAVLIAGAIVLAVVLILWVTSCRSSGQQDSYQNYMGAVGAVVNESDAIGEQLQDVITSRGSSLSQIDTQLDGLAKQQAQVVARAEGLEPPGPLISEQQSLVEAMQLRESGLVGLMTAFGQVQPADEPETAGATLAGQASRLVASDVVYEDLFKARSQEVMKNEGISGVAVPDSQFLPTLELVSQGSLEQFVRRLTQGGEPQSGLHGNSIQAVRVQPSGELLSQTEENTIIASDQLAFEVSVENSGEFQETEVRVTLTIQLSGGPINKTETIPIVNQGQTTTVEFRDFANISFGEPTTLKVAVRPVPGESNTSNNAAEYPVIFSLE